MGIRTRLFLLFTLVPLLELFILIRVGERIGALPTVALVVVTGLVGAWLARREGARTWTEVRTRLAEGRIPGWELLHAFLVLVAGAFLVTPGILTDILGLGLLIRPVRKAGVGLLRRRLERSLETGGVHVFFGDGSGPGPHAGPRGDGERHEDEDSSRDSSRPGTGRVIEL